MNNKRLLKKGIVVGILALFVGMGVIPSSGSMVVEESSMRMFDGNTLYVGGSGPDNYTSIQEAINNASDGYTIFVFDDSSPYIENIQINIRIDLIGENKETTIIDGNGTGCVINVISNYVNITGFTIQNGAYTYSAGIILGSNSNTVMDNIIINNNCTGIYITGSDNIVTENNISNNNNNGIQITNAEYNDILENTIKYNQNGVYLDDASNNTITDNLISNNYGDGIHLTGRSSYLTISNNTISDNSLNGIYSSWGEYCTIQGNTITNNGDVNNSGIYMTASSYNEIFENTIDGNIDSGIQLILWCNENVIHHNNFMNHRRNALFFTSALNRWSRNYWNRPRILPKPILGFMGIMPWLNFDWRPLLMPH